MEDGHRESKLSWQGVLKGLKSRGLKEAPRIAVGDGSLGLWAALREEFPTTKKQRCWVHKTANLSAVAQAGVLDKLPKTLQGGAKQLLHEMYLSPTKTEALKAYDQFIQLYEPKYPKACECLEKDKEELFTFYEFPAVHWRHLRTTNPTCLSADRSSPPLALSGLPVRVRTQTGIAPARPKGAALARQLCRWSTSW